MLRALFALALSLFLWPMPADAITWPPRLPLESYRTSIRNFVVWFHKAVRADRCAAALKLVDPVVDVAMERNVNPALLASIVTHESSWRPEALGRLGERGLLQVMGGKAKEPREQLREGVGILAAAYERCGTVLGAISLYATGKSCRAYPGAKLRVKLAERIEGEF